MTCVICHDSIFAAQQAEASGARGPRTRAAALSCGHVFHKRCIDRWFDTSAQTVCPTCQNVHTGTVLTLYIDYDETEALRSAGDRTTAEEAAEEDEAELRELRATVRELVEKLSHTTDMARETIQVATAERRVHNERLYELEEKDEEIARLESELSESQEENEWLGSEIRRLERQAKGHLGNIRGLQRKVREQRARIDELEEFDSEWLQSEVDRLEQLAASHSLNISGMNRKIRDQAAQISDLEYDNNEMCRVSDAHRVHIKSLQSALKSYKNMLNEYRRYNSSDSGYGYY
ncbi:hypothetical protein GGH12_004659 [Coemansia sp. RSA 1822]|nr:hypothetical protein LPJ76_004475 [Coemansia sp. RSA 638]KAJ2119626.1 hypothetical protein IW147_005735 [Coemansia sp. RSA 720]KAJ2560641.1 hypothetical protein GGH12_004659 [Coemansia sp. RSA 1822]